MMLHALNGIAIKILNKIKGRIEVIYCSYLFGFSNAVVYIFSLCRYNAAGLAACTRWLYRDVTYVAITSELVHIVTNLLGAVRSYSLRRQISPRIHLPLYSMYSNLHGCY